MHLETARYLHLWGLVIYERKRAEIATRRCMAAERERDAALDELDAIKAGLPPTEQEISDQCVAALEAALGDRNAG